MSKRAPDNNAYATGMLRAIPFHVTKIFNISIKQNKRW